MTEAAGASGLPETLAPRPLEIVFLDSWIEDRARGSGSAVAIAGLAAGLASLGHRVTRLRPRRQTPWLDLTRLLYNLRLTRRLRGRTPDLVVGFDVDGFLLRTPPSAVYVVALKGIMADEAWHETGVTRLRFRIWSRLERYNARRGSRVMVTSEHSRGVALRAYGVAEHRVRVVPEGIDIAAWEGLARTADRAPSGRALLTVARQYRRKNTARLLSALARVRVDVPEVELRVVGDGPELPRLRKLATALDLDDRVTFVGSVVDRATLQEEYRRADLFCLPSRQEGFGIVLLEAMAAGLPIVAARAGAVPEVAPDGEVALLVPADDVDALARAILRLLRDASLRRRLGATGRRRCREYDWPSVARRFLHASGVVDGGVAASGRDRGERRCLHPEGTGLIFCASFAGVLRPSGGPA